MRPAAGSCCPRPASRRRAGARPRTTNDGRFWFERAQAVAEPRAEARQRHGDRAGVHRQRRLEVLDDVGVHRADHAEVVGTPPRCGNRSLTSSPDWPARCELERRAQQRLLRRRLAQVDRGDGLAVVGQELRLVVERVDVRQAAGQEDEDEVLGLRREVRAASRARADRAAVELPGAPASDATSPAASSPAAPRFRSSRRAGSCRTGAPDGPTAARPRRGNQSTYTNSFAVRTTRARLAQRLALGLVGEKPPPGSASSANCRT